MQKFDEACKLIREGKDTEAEHILEEILSGNDQHHPSLNKLGTIRANRGQHDSAKIYFESALSINPDYAPALVNLGNILMESGELKAAEQKYKLALEKDENYHMAYYNLAVVYKKMGKLDEYLKNIKQYKRHYREYIGALNKGEAAKLKDKTLKISGIAVLLLVLFFLLS